MPNFADNWVVISGKEENIALVRKALVFLGDSSHFESFAFGQLRPVPKALELSERYIPSARAEEAFHLIHWKVENWGTKWEGMDGTLISESPTSLYLKFLTAWSPPFALYEYLQRSMSLTCTAIGSDIGGCGWEDGVWSFGNGLESFNVTMVFENYETAEEMLIPYDELTDERVEKIAQQLGVEDEDELGFYLRCDMPEIHGRQ